MNAAVLFLSSISVDIRITENARGACSECNNGTTTDNKRTHLLHKAYDILNAEDGAIIAEFLFKIFRIRF